MKVRLIRTPHCRTSAARLRPVSARTIGRLLFGTLTAIIRIVMPEVTRKFTKSSSNRWHVRIATGLLLLVVPLRAVSAQQDDPQRSTSALLTVLSYRWAWMGDTTQFDGCRVRSVVGREGWRLIGAADRQIRAMVSPVRDICPDPPNFSTQVGPLVVFLLKIEAGAFGSSIVSLQVRLGEYAHQEVYYTRGSMVDSVVLKNFNRSGRGR